MSKTTHSIDPAHRFELAYPVDNGKAYGWGHDVMPGCVVVQWYDDDSFTVLGPDDEPLGWGEDVAEALSDATAALTHRRRKADGVTPFRHPTATR